MELLRPSRSAKGSLRPCAFAAQCPLAMFYSGSVPTQRNFENLMEPQVFAALVACFMGATDGLSLGAILWCGSPTLDQRLSDISGFYMFYIYIYDFMLRLLTFNVTLRRFCFEVACFSHPLLLCRTLVLKKKEATVVSASEKWWSEANHWGTTIIKLWVCPLVCSQP